MLNRREFATAVGAGLVGAALPRAGKTQEKPSGKRLAVVTTPVGAVEDIIVDGETGLLVPPGDVDALTLALTRLVESAELRAHLGNNAMAVHRERLDLAPFAQAIRDVWLASAR